MLPQTLKAQNPHPTLTELLYDPFGNRHEVGWVAQLAARAHTNLAPVL